MQNTTNTTIAVIDLRVLAGVDACQEVTLVWNGKDDRIVFWKITGRNGTVLFKIFCAVSSCVPRIYRNL